jgi:hypothetical protein
LFFLQLPQKWKATDARAGALSAVRQQ